MIYKIIFILIVMVTSLFATAEHITKNEKHISEKEMTSLFLDMMGKTAQFYYYRNDVKFINMMEEIIAVKKANGGYMTKSLLYRTFNKYLDGKSGFYTKQQMRNKFKYIYDANISTYEVKNIKDIIYFKLSKFAYKDIAKIKTELLKQPTKIILDLRDNTLTSSKTLIELANMLVDDKTILSKTFVNDKANIKSKKYKADKKSTVLRNPKKTKIVILINNKTAGLAEAVAHSLKYHTNIITIGQSTQGYSHFFYIDKFKEDNYFALLNGEYFYNNYLVIHNIGLNPVITIKEDNSNVDKTLIRAVQYLGENK